MCPKTPKRPPRNTCGGKIARAKLQWCLFFVVSKACASQEARRHNDKEARGNTAPRLFPFFSTTDEHGYSDQRLRALDSHRREQSLFLSCLCCFRFLLFNSCLCPSVVKPKEDYFCGCGSKAECLFAREKIRAQFPTAAPFQAYAGRQQRDRVSKTPFAWSITRTACHF